MTEAQLQANSYAAGFNRAMSKYRVEAIKPFCRGKSLLDVGCGKGDITNGLAPIFHRVVGLDLTADYLVEARLNCPYGHVEFVHNSVEDFQTDERFDTILAVDVLEHVADPIELLIGLKGLLSPKGALLVVVPNAASIHRRIGVEMGYLEDLQQLQAHDFAVGHRRYYDRPSLSADIKLAGMHVQAESGILLKPFSNSQMEHLPEAYLQACFKVGLHMPDLCAELLVLAA